MHSFLWKVAAVVLTAMLLVAAGAGLGVWVAAGHYRPQLDQSAEDLTACRAARGNLETLVGDQNTAIAGLANQAEHRQAKTAQAMAGAQQHADKHFAAAQRLQQEHVDGDPVQVASDMIDKELGL
ncbi:hypothetical secreted protein [Pseudomonas knackmussii B13]|uniref:Hypothetical secreted protein n=1 Tax=Pseudomonas knackmussii (strain DSM 6978 / CCUG 54928 / LMG 23759 / B13) TaxID=1301098 RepID=A0A024HC73_PSEKB|nr:hypothetical protein [Pseudomonas knackmussii]CDF82660.1 hypothetical secreted protein [Pseudomonas knackmussii B13]